MKKLIVVVLGVLASFVLTILSARILFRFATNDAALRFAVRYVSSPLIALAVGALVGLAIRDKARVVAALSLTPWALWIVLTTNWSVATLSQMPVPGNQRGSLRRRKNGSSRGKTDRYLNTPTCTTRSFALTIRSGTLLASSMTPSAEESTNLPPVVRASTPTTATMWWKKLTLRAQWLPAIRRRRTSTNRWPCCVAAQRATTMPTAWGPSRP